MKKIRLFIAFFVVLIQTALSQTVHLRYDESLPQATYAAERLKHALFKKGYLLKDEQADYTISLAVQATGLSSEAYSIQPEKKTIAITGGDERGLIYGSLSLAEDLRNGIALQQTKGRSERPHYPFRAIKFDLPWDTYRRSNALDLHGETCKDTAYWKVFLDMMAENRFNTLTLWNLHPYTYMIKPKNFPEASPFNDKEMQQRQNLFRAIFRMARERAIDTYLVPFNIFVSPEFAKAHNVAMDNLEHHH